MKVYVSLNIACFLCGVILNASSLSNALFLPFVYPRVKLEAVYNDEVGKPLILTPYLYNGLHIQAQILARVSLTDAMGFPSYAGFFTVNKKYNSNLFFWYFPPFSKRTSAPVLLWLQGGPGCSAFYGLLSEIGPLRVKDGQFVPRTAHWALSNHLIFVDNPVGTGFSFTEFDEGYCTNEECVTIGLYNFLQQFYQLFPRLRSNEFYIAGESYAGKYIPMLGVYIHTENQKRGISKINLKGMALGNAYCDPINQIDYGNYLYQLGLLDDKQLRIFELLQHHIVLEIRNQNWPQADLLLDRLLDGDVGNFSYFRLFTGFDSYYNILESSKYDDEAEITEPLKDYSVRKALHLGGLPFNSGDLVQVKLTYDMMKSVAPQVVTLLSHYRMLFYSGQLDIVVAYPLTLKFLRLLPWSGIKEYEETPRGIWRVRGGIIAGYIKRAGNLTEVLVRNAGHMVPGDKPLHSLNLMTNFLHHSL